ncbi:hypothetical protein B0H14DRAFT_2577480 [Mycena olivaceomarginata]|nr:hypothetical protein B0H14DRAFT_2577480 [Mycena olivaceomarginata]
MAITESQKSRTVRARDKNQPKPTKPRANPGPKPGQKPRTAARFNKDDRHQDLTYHDWVQVFDYQEDSEPPRSQKDVVAYFATRPERDGGKLKEDPEESEFKFKSKDAMAAAELLQQIVRPMLTWLCRWADFSGNSAQPWLRKGKGARFRPI